jgi:hypothetical protein
MKKLGAPFLENGRDLVLIFLGYKIVETGRNLSQDGVDSSFDAILRMKLKLGLRRGVCFRKKWQMRTKRMPRRIEREWNSLTVLEKLAAAQISGTAFLPRTAQTQLPDRNGNVASALGCVKAAKTAEIRVLPSYCRTRTTLHSYKRNLVPL